LNQKESIKRLAGKLNMTIWLNIIGLKCQNGI